MKRKNTLLFVNRRGMEGGHQTFHFKSGISQTDKLLVYVMERGAFSVALGSRFDPGRSLQIVLLYPDATKYPVSQAHP